MAKNTPSSSQLEPWAISPHENESLRSLQSFPWWPKCAWDSPTLATLGDHLRKLGHAIAMTCGNYDPLHAGHIDGFAQGCAMIGASQGVPLSRVALIVGIDSDADVAAKKGAGRPVATLAHRIMMLSSIECVRCVVPFRGGDFIPAIEAVSPDGFFKGSDRTLADTPELPAVLKGLKFYRVKRRLSISSASIIVDMKRCPSGLPEGEEVHVDKHEPTAP